MKQKKQINSIRDVLLIIGASTFSGNGVVFILMGSVFTTQQILFLSHLVSGLVGAMIAYFLTGYKK